jgi:hypothetical protein
MRQLVERSPGTRGRVRRSLEALSAELARRRNEHLAIAAAVDAEDAGRWTREGRAYDTAHVVVLAAAGEADGAERVGTVAQLYRAAGFQEAREVWWRVTYLLEQAMGGEGYR